jgi:hypothetical protein
MKCSNCHEPEETPDGIIDLQDGLCDACREHNELILVINQDIRRSYDFDYSME